MRSERATTILSRCFAAFSSLLTSFQPKLNLMSGKYINILSFRLTFDNILICEVAEYFSLFKIVILLLIFSHLSVFELSTLGNRFLEMA